MRKIELFIAKKFERNFRLYPKDRRRIKKTPSLKNSQSFMLSRYLKYKYKLKDNVCISHKKNFCVIAKFKGKIGVDVEELKERNFSAIMDFCFSDDERQIVLNSKNQKLTFYKIFTLKEAYIKFKRLDFTYIKSVNFNEILSTIDTHFIKFDDFLITIITRKFRERGRCFSCWGWS
ncbi:4'-phosphopantetheinyl transferase family protein [Campylobacter suis]|uniref:4'-phosphopantetheinyl transferase domain-containing protein n=1 Tax=Campylobacter suis TaxID=2790657 RepID=A0ABM8Q057_9BACT|nr:4'-phosphopantetheinyl transferase superfamily protein [Campylobacter suis]CAD7286173.1 hypothetical protein LMG8286_00004 [Campylobacter suis]